jgi:hypothetical protein
MTGSTTPSWNIGGLSSTRTVVRSADNADVYNPALAAGNVGVLTVRTDDTDGSLTLEDGHDISTGDVIDIHWVDATGLNKVAYGATVGTVATNVVPFTGASGDVLPAAAYAVVADEQIIINTTIDGDELEMIGITPEFADVSLSKGVRLDFQDSGNATIEALALVANQPYTWWTLSGITNPFTGNPITHAHVSNGETTVCTLKIAALQDATP